MSLLLACLLLQHLLINCVSCAWWSPDFLVIGIVLATVKSPRRWMLFACVAACVCLIWAIRFRGLVMACFFLLGFLVFLATQRWNFNDRRMLAGGAGTAALLVNSLLVWADNAWSWAISGLLLFRVCATALAVYAFYPVWRWLAD